MTFLVDASTGNAVTAFLRGQGYDVLAVAESMPQAEDPDILARAVAEARIVITNDKDFGELVYRSGQAHAGILLLRLQDQRAANRVAVVEHVLQNYAAQLPNHFVVATETQIRIR
jgi:predicted nuclease of predicted toxin-antitoxin system